MAKNLTNLVKYISLFIQEMQQNKMKDSHLGTFWKIGKNFENNSERIFLKEF